MPWHQPTCLSNSICMESTTKEGKPVAEGLPEEINGIGDPRKKRQIHHCHEGVRGAWQKHFSFGQANVVQALCKPFSKNQMQMKHSTCFVDHENVRLNSSKLYI